MKTSRASFLSIATLLIAVSVTALSSKPALAVDPILLSIDINDGVDAPYHVDWHASDPLFALDGDGLINASIPFTSDPVSGADYLLSYFYDSVGHHLGIGYSVDASGNGTATTFSISATSPTFGPISNPSLIAFGNMGASDGLGILDGIVAGQIPSSPGYSFQATYGTATPTDNTFATLAYDGDFIPDPDNPDYGVTNSFSNGYTSIAGSISVMRSQWNFALAAGDQSSGTSEFDPVAVPEPSSLGLLALGSLAVLGFGRRLRKTAARA